MTRPLLPPKHIQVPTHIAYQLKLPFPILASYVLLRGLAWSSTVTPMLSMQELASLTGIPPSSLFRHMSHLSRMGVLSWRATGQGKLMLTFNDDPVERAVADQAADAAPVPKNHPGKTRESGILKNENRLSLLINPPDSSDCLIIDDKEKEVKSIVMGIKKEVINREGNSQFRESGIVSADPESGDPVAIYHSLAGLKPNPVQRRMHANCRHQPLTLASSCGALAFPRLEPEEHLRYARSLRAGGCFRLSLLPCRSKTCSDGEKRA